VIRETPLGEVRDPDLPNRIGLIRDEVHPTLGRRVEPAATAMSAPAAALLESVPRRDHQPTASAMVHLPRHTRARVRLQRLHLPESQKPFNLVWVNYLT
jgi:hypothetical protein